MEIESAAEASASRKRVRPRSVLAQLQPAQSDPQVRSRSPDGKRSESVSRSSSGSSEPEESASKRPKTNEVHGEGQSAHPRWLVQNSNDCDDVEIAELIAALAKSALLKTDRICVFPPSEYDQKSESASDAIDAGCVKHGHSVFLVRPDHSPKELVVFVVERTDNSLRTAIDVHAFGKDTPANHVLAQTFQQHVKASVDFQRRAANDEWDLDNPEQAAETVDFNSSLTEVWLQIGMDSFAALRLAVAITEAVTDNQDLVQHVQNAVREPDTSARFRSQKCIPLFEVEQKGSSGEHTVSQWKTACCSRCTC